jgi:hypothetical protein
MCEKSTITERINTLKLNDKMFLNADVRGADLHSTDLIIDSKSFWKLLNI